MDAQKITQRSAAAWRSMARPRAVGLRLDRALTNFPDTVILLPRGAPMFSLIDLGSKWRRFRGRATTEDLFPKAPAEIRIAEVEEFFAEDDRPGLAYPKLALWLSTLAVVSSVSWIWLFILVPSTEPVPTTAHPEPYSILGMGYEAAEKAVGALGMLATIFVSLLASVVAVAMINRFNLAKIKFIKDLTQTDALKTVLVNLKRHKGKYSKSKHVELVFADIRISPVGNFAAIEVVQTVNLRMPFHRNSLILDFVRLDSESDSPAKDSVRYDLHSDGVPDDSYSIDVAGIRRHFPDEHAEMFPGLVEVIVDSQPQTLAPERVNGLDNHLRWTIDVRQHVGSEPVQVMYRYRYFQEAPGFAFQQVSEPTHGFLYSLNYDRVAEHINVYPVGTLNARESGQTVGRRGGPLNQLEIGTSGWVVPNTLIVLCWYRRDLPLSAGPPQGSPSEDLATQPSHDAGTGSVGVTPTPIGDVQADDGPGVALRGHELVDTSSLDVDGNCLGVALLDGLEVFGVAPPAIDYASLSSLPDAVGALRAASGLAVSMMPPPAIGLLSRLALRVQARRLGLTLEPAHGLAGGEVALCMRSMDQLYGIGRAEGHWVMVRNDDGLHISDRLADHVLARYPDARPTDPAMVLAARGFTLKVVAA